MHCPSLILQLISFPVSSLESIEPPELSFLSSICCMSEPDLVLAMLAAMLPGLSQMNTADLHNGICCTDVELTGFQSFRAALLLFIPTMYSLLWCLKSFSSLVVRFVNQNLKSLGFSPSYVHLEIKCCSELGENYSLMIVSFCKQSYSLVKIGSQSGIRKLYIARAHWIIARAYKASVENHWYTSFMGNSKFHVHT